MPKPNVEQMLKQLGNPETPIEQRSQQLIDVLAGAEKGQREYLPIAEEVFNRLQSGATDELSRERAQFLKEILDQMESSPLRPATFLQSADIDGGVSQHALVSLDSGELAYVLAHDQPGLKKLKLGERVMLDAKSKILLHPALSGLCFGPEARLERKIDSHHIEVVSHQDEKSVVLAAPEIIAAIDEEKLVPGDPIVIDRGGRIGLKAVPSEKKSRFRFLDRGPVPDVIVERDIGSPPKIIGQVARHVREEMTRPELRRKFRLRPCITKLLCGVSGTGKTLAVQAIHRKVYDIMSEVTGTPLEQLPPRVFRFRMSKMLSMWLGESDKNVDRMFDEVEQATEETHTNADGRVFVMPVMVVMEEADGMGRSRGQDHEGVYDRILTTLLQRLDPNRHGLSNKLVVFLSTTNEPHIIDPAFLRRIGGSVETFGRLDAKGFQAVIEKHVVGLPTSSGRSKKKDWSEIINEVNRRLFEPGIDPGVVELTYQGQSEPVVKYRRDFLTGALIDRAVQEAATKAWELAIGDQPDAGITFEHLLSSLNNQVLSVAKQLVPQNVGSYLDLPEGVRVSSVRRIQTPKNNEVQKS